MASFFGFFRKSSYISAYVLPSLKNPNAMKTQQIRHSMRIAWMLCLLCLPFLLLGQGVVITEQEGVSTPHASSILDVRATDKGMLIPRLTTVQRQAIASPTNGLLVYDTDKNSFYYYDATKGGWVGVVNYDPQPAEDEPLFVVRNSQDKIVFAVYEKGVRMYVEDDAKEPKGNKSGFAIGGLTGFKDNETEYFRVTPDSVRIYLREPSEKGNKGGFAIGGLTGFKADTVALMFVAQDSTRFYIDTEPVAGGGKGNKGGFAIGGLTGFKNLPEEYLRVTRDSTRVYVNTDQTGKGNKSGFAIGGLTGFKTDPINFMFLTPENYFIGHESGANTTPGTTTAGLFNTFFGYQTGKENIVGHSNVFIGNKSGYSNIGDEVDENLGSRNVFLGFESGYSNSLGADNILIGFQAGYLNSTAGNNICIGSGAGYSNKKNSDNVFIGLNAGYYHGFDGPEAGNYNNNIYIGIEAGKGVEGSTMGKNNIYIGPYSGKSSTTAQLNVFMGYKTGELIGSGVQNVFIGNEAGKTLSSGNYNTFLGTFAGQINNGSSNTFVGESAGQNLSGGLKNTFLGSQAGQFSDAGSQNVFVGFNAGREHRAGDNNVFLGNSAGMSNSDFTGESERNVLIGVEAGVNIKEAIDNVFIGHKAGEGPVTGLTGDFNVIIGERAGNHLSSGNSNIFLGTQAGFENTEGQYNVFLGHLAGMSNTTTNSNIAIGYEVAKMNTTGGANVMIGNNVASQSSFGSWNVLIGHETANSETFSGQSNVMVGTSIGSRLTNAQKNVFLGDLVANFNTSGSENVFIGALAGYSNTTANSNIFIGTESGFNNSTGQYNVFLGFETGKSNTEGVDNVFLGYQAGHSNSIGEKNVFIGYLAGEKGETTVYNTFVGSEAGQNTINETGDVGDLTGKFNSFYGTRAGQSNTYGYYNSFFGNGAGWNSTIGIRNTFLGNNAGYQNQGGNENTFVGNATGYYHRNGDFNTYIGSRAGQYSYTGATKNVALGAYAGYGNTSGSTGSDNISIGYESHKIILSGSRNISIGSQAGAALTTGTNNIFLGHEAGANHTGSSNVLIGYQASASTNSFTNIVAIGNGVQATASNQVRFGNGSTTTMFCQGAYASTTTSAPNLYVDFNGQIMRSTNTFASSTGAANKVAIWIGTSTLSSNTNFHWDNTNARLGVGTIFPNSKVHINSATGENGLRVEINSNTKFWVQSNGGSSIGAATTAPENGLFVAGNIGIGTGEPFKSLHVRVTNAATDGTDGTYIDIQNPNNSNGSMTGVRFKPTAGVNGEYTKGAIFYQRTASGGRGTIIFANNNSSGIDEVTTAHARMVILNDGKVGIGTTSPSQNLHVVGTSFFDVGTYKIFLDTYSSEPAIRPSTAWYGYLGTPTHYWYQTHTDQIFRNNEYALSDRRVKTNIKDINSPLQKVMVIKGYHYSLDINTHPLYKDGKRANSTDDLENYGFVAQELMEVIPEMVVLDQETGYYMIRNFEQLLPVIIEAMKEQQVTIQALEEKVSEFDKLSARLEAVEKLLLEK